MVLGNMFLIAALIAATCAIAFMLMRKPSDSGLNNGIGARFGALFAGFYLLLGTALMLIGLLAGGGLSSNMLMLLGIPWTSLGALLASDGLQASASAWQPEMLALGVVGVIINTSILYRLGQRIALSLREPQL